MKCIDAKIIIEYLKNSKLKLVTIESASCGNLANTIANYNGVSSFYIGGYIVYSLYAKHKMLGIKNSILNQHGTISYKTAYYMVKNAVKKNHCDIGISITGNAGPDPIENKPNGLYYVGIKYINNIYLYKVKLNNILTRNQQRQRISLISLNLLFNILNK